MVTQELEGDVIFTRDLKNDMRLIIQKTGEPDLVPRIVEHWHGLFAGSERVRFEFHAVESVNASVAGHPLGIIGPQVIRRSVHIGFVPVPTIFLVQKIVPGQKPLEVEINMARAPERIIILRIFADIRGKGKPQLTARPGHEVDVRVGENRPLEIIIGARSDLEVRVVKGAVIKKFPGGNPDNLAKETRGTRIGIRQPDANFILAISVRRIRHG
ncbi:MAG: hypothetical protein BWY49_00054 [Candidatus Omnitrophica bacterium ADurb.Bin314]|nr:MAG: hypothetical protein BWY49_00054 [Candidatus Omnitrophica bacterium ADurb.Bin314]